MYGGINDIRGRAFGHLTLALTGQDDVIDATLQHMNSRITVKKLA